MHLIKKSGCLLVQKAAGFLKKRRRREKKRKALAREALVKLHQGLVDVALHNAAAGKRQSGLQHRAQIGEVEEIAEGFFAGQVLLVAELHNGRF